ncbi:L-ascorbate oxidase [Dichanthelium oligosanthes]|uniref:L-ascorbate oxidase n=1 Tax=Dichanthelium oligosanthes TaxID=888268 RepID=A0A1E5V378_9POAL|nr:L-ascorbate oxidase [Dichanthelium oligosanthes]
MLVLAHPVAPASRGIVMPPAQTPNAPAPATTTPAPAPAPITPTITAPALAPASVPVTPTAPVPDPAPDHQSPRHIWNVEYILWAPDCKQLGMIGIHGSFPGPTIYAYAGDRITVVVNNKLHTKGVVIHWHGIKQIGTPWADGTASISQCPINPRETFTYEFTADKPGTYLYHGHFGMQRAAGLYGLLIVHDRDDPFKKDPKYASDLNMLLSDWYHEAVYAQAAGLERKDKHFQWIGEPQTILINGRGQFRCSLGITRDRRACDRRKKDAFCQEGDKSERCELIRRSECGPFCEGSQCSPVVFAVEPGKMYRLRIASTTSLSALNVQVQGHKLTVVEADGNLVEPFDVESIDIYSGESYSVLLNTTAEKQESSYWISVGVIGRTPKTPPALAALKYTGSKGELPVKAPPAAPAWNDVERSKKLARDLKARVGTDPPPEKVDRRIDMLNTQDLVDGQIKWAINHVSLSLPATPYLGAYKSGIQDQAFNTTAEAPSTFVSSYDIEKPPKDQKQEAKRNVTVSDRVYRLTHGHVIDVVLQNADMMRDDVSESHPWHLHGHDFWVLGYGDGRYDHEMATKNKELDVVNPRLRNTVVLFPHGWTAIRFVADNPGVWAFHCHIEPHLHMGMGVIFAEGMEAEKLHELDVPREAMMCGKTAVAASPPLLAPAMPPSP